MKVEAFFEAVGALPTGTIEQLTQGRPFVVISPHPDDESLGCGGLIAGARQRGTRVDVVMVTDGSGSHTQSVRYPREALIALRREEALAAGLALGLEAEALTFLGLPDAAAPSSGPLFEDTLTRIEAIIKRSGAKALFVTWRHDPHCDHEAAAAMARGLRARNPDVILWAYSIWGWHLDPDADVECDAPRGLKIDVTAWREAKLTAIGAHASQMSDLIDDDPTGFRMTEAQRAPFVGQFEYFFEVDR